MDRIKVNVGYSERNDVLYHVYFDIIDELPDIGTEYSYYGIVEEINPMRPDRVNNDKVWDYDYYQIVVADPDIDPEEDEEDPEAKYSSFYVAVKKEDIE